MRKNPFAELWTDFEAAHNGLLQGIARSIAAEIKPAPGTDAEIVRVARPKVTRAMRQLSGEWERLCLSPLASDLATEILLEVVHLLKEDRPTLF